MNLLGNALKFTESGFILVSLRFDTTPEAKTPMTIKVSDTGIGMSRDFLFKEAFVPFRKHNPHSTGTGVGLTVVRRIIEEVGGWIEITSESNKGTEITLQLPLKRYTPPGDPDSTHGSVLATLSRLRGRKTCILHSKVPDASGPAEHLRQWQALNLFVRTMRTTGIWDIH